MSVELQLPYADYMYMTGSRAGQPSRAAGTGSIVINPPLLGGAMTHMEVRVYRQNKLDHGTSAEMNEHKTEFLVISKPGTSASNSAT